MARMSDVVHSFEDWLRKRDPEDIHALLLSLVYDGTISAAKVLELLKEKQEEV